MNEKPTITLPLSEAIEAAWAVLPHVSKDDITPVLTHAELKGNRLTGTDRYTVGSFQLSSEVSSEFLVPRTAVEWLSKINPRTLVGYFSGGPLAEYEARITGPAVGVAGPDLLGESVMVEVLRKGEPERMQQFTPYVGKFPPVTRLLDGHEAAVEVVAVKLRAEFVERFTKYANKFRGRSVRFLIGKSADPKKPGAVHLSVGNLSGLVQPDLLQG